jgi:hypothetical protein
MVAVLKTVGALVIAGCCLAMVGCKGNDADAPVANPPGAVPPPVTGSEHPAGKKLVPIGGMQPAPGGQPMAPAPGKP